MNRKPRQAEDVVVEEPPVPAGPGKNAPTPKRSEARAARAKRAKSAPVSRKERSQRVREIRAETMESLKQTDVAKLPKNERVPELVFARDQIDTRRNLAGSLYWVIGVYFVGTTVAGSVHSSVFQLSILLLSIFWFLGIITDTTVAGRRIASRVLARWPDSTVRIRGYVFRRALTPKRWRRPVARQVPEQNRWDAAA